ncbi:MAG: RAD55 family ATPase [Haloarculaceae archaeon]
MSEEDAEDARVRRCDYCRLPIPKAPVEMAADGETYTFCSAACREAVSESDRVFTQYHGHRRLDTGVSVLDAALPEGVPRNSFVMLTDLAGTRTEAIQAELAWRALQRGEPVVIVSFLEPPVSLIHQFVALEWNVLPYLEDDQLHVLDCFTYRVGDRERMHDRMNPWNAHLTRVADDATTRIRDPSEFGELNNRLDRALEAHDMQDRGVVVVDSLTELGSLVQPVQAYDFVKNLRADVCKGRFVPVFAGATVTGDGEAFPHDLTYMADGIVEMRLDEEMVEGALIKQLRVRKMSGVLTYPEWSVYEYTAGDGIVTFDPREEMADEGDGNSVEQGNEDGVGQGNEDDVPDAGGERGTE